MRYSTSCVRNDLYATPADPLSAMKREMEMRARFLHDKGLEAKTCAVPEVAIYCHSIWPFGRFYGTLFPSAWMQVLDITLNGISITSDATVYQKGKGIIVDSGTTDTYLPKSVASGFSKAWEAVTGSVRNAASACWHVPVNPFSTVSL